jgi:histidinol-phosphate/aromatic aminotransferase/cobyric acid decarboxylase-like protein
LRLYQVGFETIPLADDFSIQVGGYTKPNGGIIFPNPNAPTGCPVPLTDIERLLQANTESVVVVDEAYVDFGGESAIPLIARYPNLLVVQTLSKSRSLAGLRVGFAVGHADLIEALERVKNSFNSYPLDRLAIAGAVAAFEDRDYFDHDLQGRHRHPRAAGRRIESAGLRGAALGRPTSSSPAIRNTMPKSRRWRYGNAASSCATSSCRASSSSCGLRWVPTSSARRWSRH